MEIYKGNAALDGQLTRQWFIGSFLPDDDLRHSDEVEIKWGVHKKGEAREDWSKNEGRKTVCILVSGQFVVQLPDEDVQLLSQGDYAMWDIGINHKWQAIEDSIVLTIRWPSLLHR